MLKNYEVLIDGKVVVKLSADVELVNSISDNALQFETAMKTSDIKFIDLDEFGKLGEKVMKGEPQIIEVSPFINRVIFANGEEVTIETRIVA